MISSKIIWCNLQQTHKFTTLKDPIEINDQNTDEQPRKTEEISKISAKNKEKKEAIPHK